MNDQTTSERRPTEKKQTVISTQFTDLCRIMIPILWYKDGVFKIDNPNISKVLQIKYDELLNVDWHEGDSVTSPGYGTRTEAMLENAKSLVLAVNSKTQVLEAIHITPQ